MGSALTRKVNRLVNKDRGNVRDLRWWNKKHPHETVWENYKRVGTQTSGRRAQDLYFACLYDDSELATAALGGGSIGEFTPQTLACNIVRRQVDTYTSKIVKNRPVPMGLTTGGNYSQQRRAKAISKFFEGVLDNVNYWPTRAVRVRDNAIWGSGFALNYRVGRKMVHDRAYPWEFRVDPRDAHYGKPRTLYLGRYVDKLVLAERFPEHEEEIFQSDATAEDGSWSMVSDEGCNLALTVEAWHLPSGEGADDGCHAICVSNATLAIGDYSREYFPISKSDYSAPLMGWWGEGMVKQLAGLQYEVNAIGMRLQERHYLMGTYVAREANSDLEWESVDNGTMTELVYTGVAPQFMTPPAAHGDLFNWFQMLRTQMPGEITGQSGLSTRSEKPPGLDSGKAVRTYHDIDTENLTTQGRNDEDDVINTCWQMFDLAEEIYSEQSVPKPHKALPAKGSKAAEAKAKADKPFSVRIEQRKYGKSVLETISYKDVRLDKEEFTLRVFPTSFLSSTPEDRFSQVQEMIKAGFLSEDEAMALLDFPDVERVLTLRGAARRNIERILERILDCDGDPRRFYVYPEPAMNLELCQVLGVLTYLDAMLDGAPEENLKLVLQFSLDAKAEIAKAKAGDTADAASQLGPGGPADAAEMLPPGATVAMPDQAPMPAGAVAPEVMPAMPPGVL